MNLFFFSVKVDIESESLNRDDWLLNSWRIKCVRVAGSKAKAAIEVEYSNTIHGA